MPYCHIKFTFNEHIEVNEELVKKTQGEFSEEILEEFEYEDECIDFLKEFIEALQKCDGYEYDGSDRERAILSFPSESEGTKLAKIFGLKILSEEWDDEGSNRYYSYTFVPKSKHEDKLIKQLRDTVKELKDYGVEVEYKIKK